MVALEIGLGKQIFFGPHQYNFPLAARLFSKSNYAIRTPKNVTISSAQEFLKGFRIISLGSTKGYLWKGKGSHGRRKRGRSQLISALGLGSPRLCTIFQLGVVCPVFSIIMLESLYLFQSSL